MNVPDVADHHLGTPACTVNLALNRFEFTPGSAKENHLGSRLSQSNRCGSAKTTARARYERDTVVQPEGFRQNGGMETRGYNSSPGLATCPA